MKIERRLFEFCEDEGGTKERAWSARVEVVFFVPHTIVMFCNGGSATSWRTHMRANQRRLE